MKRQRMARKITLRLFFMGVVSLAFTAMVFLLVFYHTFHLQTWNNLKATAHQAAAGYSALENKAQIAQLAVAPLRLTLVDPTGEVLYDSQVTVSENHLSRPEILDAAADGEGRDFRRSATVGYHTYYYAIRLEDGSILRLAQNTKSIWSIFISALPVIFLAGLSILALSFLLSEFWTRRLLQPLQYSIEHLNDIHNNIPYTELEPLAEAIHSDHVLRENNEALRREFTANISHELKTPLTSISGYAELIANDLVKPEDIPIFAKRIGTEAARMTTLVNDILALSRLDSLRDVPPTQQDLSRVDLDRVVGSCAARLRINAQRAFVTLSVQASPACVLGDRAMLDELCQNLCDNAIRYNRPGGKVKLCCGVTPAGLPYLQVRDNGIGIPQDVQDRVFERFYRVDKSRSKATGGTGLGLAIVKHIAMIHNAQLQLESGVDQGTCITITFPQSENSK